MIYIKEYNSLFSSPKPNVGRADYWNIDTQEEQDAIEDVYTSWLSSKLPIVGEHTFEDGKDYREGIDYEIVYQYSTKVINNWTHHIDTKSALPIKESKDDVASNQK
jgi:hypothetical protein